jgi:hypothetical protein
LKMSAAYKKRNTIILLLFLAFGALAIIVEMVLSSLTVSWKSIVEKDFMAIEAALEAYHIDHLTYPPNNEHSLRFLTTPVAYMLHEKEDPYAHNTKDNYYRYYVWSEEWDFGQIKQQWAIWSCGSNRKWDNQPDDTLTQDAMNQDDIIWFSDWRDD